MKLSAANHIVMIEPVSLIFRVAELIKLLKEQEPGESVVKHASRRIRWDLRTPSRQAPAKPVMHGSRYKKQFS